MERALAYGTDPAPDRPEVVVYSGLVDPLCSSAERYAEIAEAASGPVTMLAGRTAVVFGIYNVIAVPFPATDAVVSEATAEVFQGTTWPLEKSEVTAVGKLESVVEIATAVAEVEVTDTLDEDTVALTVPLPVRPSASRVNVTSSLERAMLSEVSRYGGLASRVLMLGSCVRGECSRWYC